MAFPEIPEDAAPPGIAAVYAGLRDALGIPVVNLIWRHFATLPGALDWAWATLRPAMGSAELQAGMARLEALVTAVPEALPVATPEQLAVIETYNRGNTENLLLLNALRLALAEPAGGGVASPGPALPPLPAVPPMPALGSLDAAALSDVRALAALHGEAGAATVPSLYRHLAIWPGMLAPLRAGVAALPLAATRDALMAEAMATARRLLPALRPPGTAPHAAALKAALDAFAGQLIAEMTVVGIALRLRARRHKGA
jgi:hypothetical protein